MVAGIHQHYFQGATQTLNVGVGDVLCTYVYLDPGNLPSELMLQWNDGNWEHRAYWGQNLIPWGTNGTVSRRYMGALPAQAMLGWVRLEVPASLVGLEGRTVNGMAYTLYNGRAWWDRAGLRSATWLPTHTTTDSGQQRITHGTTSVTGTNLLLSGIRCCFLVNGQAWRDRAGVRSATWLPTKYYYFNGQKIAQRNNGVSAYLHGDHPSATLRASLLSTSLTTNSGGTLTGDVGYTAYGRYRRGSEVVTENRFTGQKLDQIFLTSCELLSRMPAAEISINSAFSCNSWIVRAPP